MANIKLTITYDGTPYLGWQKTKMGPSIEETLEGVLAQLLREKVDLQAASRTDAGVHANSQVINFISDRAGDLEKLKKGLNALLPEEIAVIDVQEAEAGFHPTLDCKSKEYRYYLSYHQVRKPHERRYCWHTPSSLSVDLMKEAAKYFIGQHDFSAFSNGCKNNNGSDFIRNLYKVKIEEMGGAHLCIIIEGDRFLYKMVRNIVGTLVYIGKGKIAIEELPSIFKNRSRCNAGVTAPAHGLFLHALFYP